MLWLKTYTERIQGLIDTDTPQSLTYAALEARLAIERVCYERLRVAHDYISQADIKKWQPKHVVTKLMQEVDPHVAGSFTLSISTTPAKADEDCSIENFSKYEYVEVGTQVGFDSAKLGKLWHALGNFLHVRMPQTKSDGMESYADIGAIRPKVEDALGELRLLEKGTLVASGVGETVYFDCACGFKNMRRAALLKEGQEVSCINPECKEKWSVSIEDGDIMFTRQIISVKCHSCAEAAAFAQEPLLKLERNTRVRYVCASCGAENFLMWKLMHEKKSKAA
jgi:hypothetical protein